ncbi:MAG: hypothetical protein RL536_546 [Candidatus Parcubacteria bacterium]|jgi:mRNA-degrading endonuclease toxin of MazEF toxin-antitoxin module
MYKDFDRWNEDKKKIHDKTRETFYHEREIWWCSLGLNIGFEQDGGIRSYRRPVLILKGLSSDTCLIAPLTQSQRRHKFRVPIGPIETKPSSALISQIRIIDVRRLINKVGYVNEELFHFVKQTVRDLL